MKRAVWERSVSVDKQGLAWVGGTRADFVFVLFMHGFSIEELCEGLIDGFRPTREAIEDAIRYGMRRKR